MAVTAVPADGTRITPSDRRVGLAWGDGSEQEPMFEGTFRQCRVKLAKLMRQHRATGGAFLLVASLRDSKRFVT